MNIKENLESCVFCLNKSSCFRALNTKELEYSNDNRVQLNFKSGEIIAKQGSFATHIMFIKHGLVKVFMEIPNYADKSFILNILPAGNLIGLPSLYNDKVFSYSATAIEDTVVCLIDIKIIRELLESNGKFAAEVMRAMNACSNATFKRFVSLTHKQLNGRLADALLYLSEEIYKDKRFKLTLSRKDLAELTGATTASVIKGIKDLKESGIINMEKGQVEITNIEKLKTISQFG